MDQSVDTIILKINESNKSQTTKYVTTQDIGLYKSIDDETEIQYNYSNGGKDQKVTLSSIVFPPDPITKNHIVMSDLKIPEAFKIKPLNSDSYLVNGAIKKWPGQMTKVYSVIGSKDATGNFGPTLLGSVPDMGEETALEAVNAANEAYNRGKGIWPTMSVTDRLKLSLIHI